MARRRAKKRTQASFNGAHPNGSGKNPMGRSPKSMVIRMGASEVGTSVSQLVRDMRTVMEPDTAARLQERRSNKLRDYTTMCGPLGVTHLLLFSRSKSGNTNMRLAVFPRGPTLHFKVENYSLCKDILHSLKRSKPGSKLDFLAPPLLVMNNFMSPTPAAPEDPNQDQEKNVGVPKHVESLCATIFQSLFPPISPQSTVLSSIRRVLLLNRETNTSTGPPSQPPDDSPSSSSGRYVLTLRHYAISTPLARTARRSLPRPIRKLQNAGSTLPKSQRTGKRSTQLPDLGRLDDISQYLLDSTAAGYTSVSDTDGETEAEVEVAAPVSRKALSQRDRLKLRQRLQTQQQQQQGKTDDAAGEDVESDVDFEDADDGTPEPKADSSNKAPTPTVEQRAVKLAEMGPRMRLRLMKIEEGLCEGRVMWHEFVEKTAEEEAALEATWAKRRAEREERRRVQRENVERKKKEKKKAGRRGQGDDEDEDEEDEDEGMEDWEDYEFDEDGEGGVGVGGSGEGDGEGDSDAEMQDA